MHRLFPHYTVWPINRYSHYWPTSGKERQREVVLDLLEALRGKQAMMRKEIEGHHLCLMVVLMPRVQGGGGIVYWLPLMNDPVVFKSKSRVLLTQPRFLNDQKDRSQHNRAMSCWLFQSHHLLVSIHPPPPLSPSSFLHPLAPPIAPIYLFLF